jgi:hypothetical protein
MFEYFLFVGIFIINYLSCMHINRNCHMKGMQYTDCTSVQIFYKKT